MRRLLVVVLALAATLLGVPAMAASGGYAALGDSYSSGLGTGSFTLDAPCKRGTKAYPYLYSGSAAGFVACSGADIASVRATQLAATADARLVTLTIGGNDIGFIDVVTRCTLINSNSTCTNAVAAATAKIPAMRADLVALLHEIRATAPTARIVLLGYPYLYSTGACRFGQPGLTKRLALHRGADALDKALEGAAAEADARFVDVRAAFAGHDICASSSRRWINGLNLLRLSESFHPNAAGHANGYLPALRSAVPATVGT